MDVHYYEDGNVRMSTSKKVELSSSGGAEAVVREIAKAENKFQEELNRAFGALAEGSFKGLRRQLPVTRQRVEWEKIGGYRVSALLSSWLVDGVLTLCCSWGRISGVGGRDESNLRLRSPSHCLQQVPLEGCCVDAGWSDSRKTQLSETVVPLVLSGITTMKHPSSILVPFLIALVRRLRQLPALCSVSDFCVRAIPIRGNRMRYMAFTSQSLACNEHINAQLAR